MLTERQKGRLLAYILTRYPNLSAFDRAMGRQKNYHRLRLEMARKSRVALQSADVEAALAHLGRTPADLDGDDLILCDGDAERLAYFEGGRERIKALQRHKAAHITRLVAQGLVEGVKWLVLTPAGRAVLARLAAAVVAL